MSIKKTKGQSSDTEKPKHRQKSSRQNFGGASSETIPAAHGRHDRATCIGILPMGTWAEGPCRFHGPPAGYASLGGVIYFKRFPHPVCFLYRILRIKAGRTECERSVFA